MKIGEAFPSSYIKVEDLKGRRVPVTIERVEVETLGQGKDQETKPVVYFKGAQKGLVLNRTNANTITDLCGTDETDEWVGHRIVLYQDKTDFQGKRVACIRIAEAPKATPPAAKKPAPPADEDTLAEGEGFQASEEDVAFLDA